jgi:hypothetical protein
MLSHEHIGGVEETSEEQAKGVRRELVSHPVNRATTM